MRKRQRTSIEDLQPIGSELSSETLHLVSGGLRLSGGGSSAAKATGIEMEPIIVIGGPYPCTSHPDTGVDYCFP